MWQNDCKNNGLWNRRQASSLSSSAVIGPVVSCDSTVVILGSHARSGQDARETDRLAHDLLRLSVALAGLGLGVLGVAEDIGVARARAPPAPWR